MTDIASIAYVEKRFSKKSRAIIESACKIIGEYERQGFVLTFGKTAIGKNRAIFWKPLVIATQLTNGKTNPTDPKSGLKRTP